MNPAVAGPQADLVAGNLRTDENNMHELMHLPNAVFLKHINEQNEIDGCVFLQIREGRLYLGMLCVSPVLQSKGIGKQLRAAAEQYAKQKDCLAIFMRVISIRHELIAWYERQGYINTGETEPFPEGQFGTATRTIEFVKLEKKT